MSGRNETGAPAALNDNAFVIGPSVRIDGRIDFDGPIWLRAPFEGIITCRSLLVDVGASCTGVIVAEKVAVRGKVDAEVYASVLELKSGCSVTGAAYHSELLLEPGAQFEGKSRRSQDPLAEVAQRAEAPAVPSGPTPFQTASGSVP